MSLRIVILVLWLAWGSYWLVAAARANDSVGRRRFRFPSVLVVVSIVLLRGFGVHTLSVHSVALRVVGMVIFVSGLGLAVWARIYLGRNWGMPMTERAAPELVTTGPYRFVRHPIYSGLLLGILGTSLATNLYLLIADVVMCAYFVYSARVEEGNMTASFPDTYPGYKAETKMLIPFVL